MELRLYLLGEVEKEHTVDLPKNTKNFLVRVQLANSDDYDDLHEVMSEAGFQRELKARNNDRKQLPDAMYFLAAQGEYCSAETVHEMVEKAVAEHRLRTDQPNVTAQTLVVAVSDAWFELDNVKDD